MGPESRVVPSLSCVIERLSNHACQKVSRCPLTRMTYIIRLCSVRIAILLCRTRIQCQREKHRSQKDTLRYHFFSERGRSRGAKRTPGSWPRDLRRWKSSREPDETGGESEQRELPC